jgi:predicted ATP-dependent endonuclease of OLD family
VLKLPTSDLPNAKHLLQIVNSQNNEAIFFADEVVLVEGISDRIFFEAVLDRFGRGSAHKSTVEVISVGGKGLFKSYTKLLSACKVRHSIIADRDYIEEIGTDEIKSLFTLDESEIKKDVIENIKSTDGKALVENIERAIAAGSWKDAESTWQYIKSRRRRLKESLGADEKERLEKFISDRRVERIYLLKNGVLEDYLPDGFRDKDLDKLVGFLATDFWSKLPEQAREELTEIAQLVLPGATELAPAAKPPRLPWYLRRTSKTQANLN